jgi:hypothetical protein
MVHPQHEPRHPVLSSSSAHRVARSFVSDAEPSLLFSRPIPVILIWPASIPPGDRVLGLYGILFRQVQQSLGPDVLGCQDRQPSDDQEDPGARSHHHDDARQEQDEPCGGHGDSLAAPGDEPQNHPEREPRPVCNPIERMTHATLTNGSVGERAQTVRGRLPVGGQMRVTCPPANATRRLGPTRDVVRDHGDVRAWPGGSCSNSLPYPRTLNVAPAWARRFQSST